MKKRSITNQQYEDYWKLTLEYSDFSEKQFNDVLNIIVEFIDTKVDSSIGITSAQYKKLQEIIESIYPKKDSASTRKSINQFFKLGFINNYGKSYHPLTKKFLAEKDPEVKKLIYSQIMYANASFSRSVTREAHENEIKFLVKTLEECSTITKKELLALMYTKISEEPNGYLTKEELNKRSLSLLVDGAMDRKYNQVNYLFNLCKSLTDIYVHGNDTISITPEVCVIKADKPRVRDPYLQHLYKVALVSEYKSVYQSDTGACVLEKLSYPYLIASHIKPYRNCSPTEEFDRENGLLLSKNMDSLFDNGYITFDDFGKIISSSLLHDDVKQYLEQFVLDEVIYTPKRREYMEYHRAHVFKA
ncbi:MAG: HNH endonuclease [Clostridia bacterium]|nr:HNH endonuclease [Clostridia bacterium]